MTQLLERPIQGINEPAALPPTRKRWAWMVPVVAAVVLGIVAILLSTDTPPPSNRLLITDDAGTVSLIDPEQSTPVFSIDSAVAAPDGETIFRTKPEGADTQVDELDATNGSVVATQVVSGRLEIVAVSPDGDAVALMPEYGGNAGIYAPAPREQTSITVVRRDGSEPRTYDLEGNFEPETFSLDEDTLFLVEFWPPMDPDRYFVRQLDLEAGAIREAYSPEVVIEPAMRGKARAQALDPDGEYLYTLYSIDGNADPLHDPTAVAPDDGEYWSFIHVLDLREEKSICIFLPNMFGRWSEDRIGMGISPDGSSLYVVDAITGSIAVVDTESHQVDGVVQVDKIQMDRAHAQRPSVVVGSKGRLYVTKGSYIVIELDATDGFEATDAIGVNVDEPIHGLNISPDGVYLRMAVGNEIVIFDLAKGEEVRSVTVSSTKGGQVDFVGAPPGTVTRFPLDCAC